MKRIKSGICKDFDKIPHKPKEEMLADIGVTLKHREEKRNFVQWRILIAAAICVLLVTAGAGFALALENSEFAGQIKNYLGIDNQQENSDNVSISDDYTEENKICFIDTISDNGGYVASVNDIAVLIQQDFYYPAQYDQQNLLTVMYNTRSYVSPPDYETQHQYCNLQFTAMFDPSQRFWVNLNHTETAYSQKGDIAYESHGTVFYIRKNSNNDSNYYALGILEGNSYSFTADTVEAAKSIIDSLKKTNS